jgi:hypothetical protein
MADRDDRFRFSRALLTNEAENETSVGVNCADLIVDRIARFVMESAFGGQVLEGTGERHTRGLTVQTRDVNVTMV